MILHMIRRK